VLGEVGLHRDDVEIGMVVQQGPEKTGSGLVCSEKEDGTGDDHSGVFGNLSDLGGRIVPIEPDDISGTALEFAAVEPSITSVLAFSQGGPATRSPKRGAVVSDPNDSFSFLVLSLY
jgi:hypothetical protein